MTRCPAYKFRHLKGAACYLLGAIQVLRNADGDGGVQFAGKKHYEGVRFSVISVTKGGRGPISRKNVLRNT